MARKRQDVSLMAPVESQEDWDELMTKEGLIVVDVYQSWSGPCKSMHGPLKRWKNETSDDLLVYAEAKADLVDSLEWYRGSCCPTYLIYAGGQLVGIQRGPDVPKLHALIIEQLACEHKVMAGEAERVEIQDPMFEHLRKRDTQQEEEADMSEDEEEGDMVTREFSVVLIKPDCAAAEKRSEILERIDQAGFEILQTDDRCLLDEEAREFYKEKVSLDYMFDVGKKLSEMDGEEYFEDLITFMTQDPCAIIVASTRPAGRNSIAEMKNLAGLNDPHKAKQKDENSLRAMFGTSVLANAIHCSDNAEAASRELAFFFPNYSITKVTAAASQGDDSVSRLPSRERTLAIIRPSALALYRDKIVEHVKELGFEIMFKKEMELTLEQAQEFYKEHADQPYFDDLATEMSSGPLLALCLERAGVVEAFRHALGPKLVADAKETNPDCLRAKFEIEGKEINGLHGSDTPANAAKELEFFFPMEHTVGIIKPDAEDKTDEIIEKVRAAGFNIAAQKETQLTRDIVDELYPNLQSAEFFNEYAEYLQSGNVTCLILTRENAVSGWRELVGPTDPDEARDSAPDTLRAQFGADMLHNAVHGATPGFVGTETQKLFGDVTLKPDGSIVLDGDAGSSSSQKQQYNSSQLSRADADVTSGAGDQTEDDEEDEGDEVTDSDDAEDV